MVATLVGGILEGCRETGGEEHQFLPCSVHPAWKWHWPSLPHPQITREGSDTHHQQLATYLLVCKYWSACDKHSNRRSSDAAAEIGLLEMFPTNSSYYPYNLSSLLPANHEIADSATRNWTHLTSSFFFFPLPVVVFHMEFWWALGISVHLWSKGYKKQWGTKSTTNRIICGEKVPRRKGSKR